MSRNGQARKREAGFTLIELVMVIVILGILAAVAAPKFTDISDDAKAAVVDGVAGAIQSAAVVYIASHQGTAGTAAEILAEVNYDSSTVTATAGNCTVALDYDGETKTVTIPADICTASP